MSADSDAFATVQQLPGLTPAEQQYLLSVARGEGFYGLGWGNPSAKTIELSAQFGIDPRAGVGSNNWGAEQKQGSAGSFPHIDHDSQGKPYVEQYKRHKTPAEGAASVARILLKPNLREALRTGFYPGPPSLSSNANANQRKFHASKLALAGSNIGPLKAAVFTQHDNRYYELDPLKYLEAVSRNYATLTKNLGWEPLLTKTTVVETIAALPLAGGQSSSLPLESSGEHLPCPLPEAGFLRGQKYSVPGIQDEPKK